MARSSVSLQDVAKEAGVSPQTVSRVANGSAAVRPETQSRVEEAMKNSGTARIMPRERSKAGGSIISACCFPICRPSAMPAFSKA